MTRTKTLRLMCTAAAVIAAAATAVVVTNPAHAESNGGVKVMPLGDSITDGIFTPGGYRIGLWQRFTAAGQRVDFVGSLSNGPSNLGDHDHEGHSGWRIDQIDANIVSWLRTYNPHTILLHIGTNDISQNYNVSSAPSRLATLIDHITATVPDAEVFVAQVLTLSYNDSGIRAYNAQIPGIVSARASAGKHVHLVNMYSALSVSDLVDGVHPNANGYDKMAAVWYSALQSVPGSLGQNGSSSTSSSSSSSSSSSTSSSSSSSSSTATSSGTTGSSSSSSGTAACSATYTVAGQWTGGFQATVKVTAGSAPISGWTIRWTFANGQTVSSAWNATITSSGSSVTATNVGYNGALGAGASATFGFLGASTGTNSVPSVTCTAA